MNSTRSTPPCAGCCMSDSRMFVLSHPESRRRAAKACAEAPDGYVVRITEPKRSLAQNALLHATMTEIARDREWCGRKWPVDVWKRLLTAAWCRANGESVAVVPALDGHGVDVVFRRTSRLSRQECASLIEYINAWEAAQGQGKNRRRPEWPGAKRE